jgi:superfamily I DNA/RNA helicase
MVPLITSSYDDAAPRLEDLGALVWRAPGRARLSDVAAEQALEPPASTGDLAGPPMIDEDWLVLSTVHSAKGLEFDAVHVIHAADGNFPLGHVNGITRRLRGRAPPLLRRDHAGPEESRHLRTSSLPPSSFVTITRGPSRRVS